MIELRRHSTPGAGSPPRPARWRDLERSALAVPEGIAFRLLERAAFRRVFSPARDTLESAALRVVEKTSLSVLDWIAGRSIG